MMQAEIIKSTIDVLAGFDLLTAAGRVQAFELVIDALGSYPKPQKKGAAVRAETHLIGAYLYVSTARNTCKLAAFGYEQPAPACLSIMQNLEAALTLLLK